MLYDKKTNFLFFIEEKTHFLALLFYRDKVEWCSFHEIRWSLSRILFSGLMWYRYVKRLDNMLPVFPLAPGGESKKTSEKSETSRIKFHDEEYPDLFRTTRKPQPAGMPTFQLLNFLKQLFSLRRGFPILVEILQLYTVSEPCCPSGPLCEMP